jgi:hypothetical protein
MPEPPGTSASRERIFLNASAPAVLCIDAHVLLPTGVVRHLIHWYDSNPETMDFFQGPLVMDNHRETVEAFDDLWRENMWGTWKHDPRGEKPNGQPFEIEAMGLGLFTCRKEAWLRFPEGLRGFGGEEHMLHAMWRQAGRKVWCLPWLRWWHLFRDQTTPQPYPNDNWDRIRNYVIWAQHLKMDIARLRDHFVGRQIINESDWDALVKDPIHTVARPSRPTAGCGTCGGGEAIPDSMTLEDLYQRARITPSDINEHTPKLRELASQCEHVTEFGMRHGVSTVALLSAQPKRFVTYDLHHDVMANVLTSRRGKTDFAFILGNVLAVEIEPTDLLFIDTIHTAMQLAAELARHAEKVRRYIVLHDTQVYGERGENGQPGLLVALRDYLRSHPEWSIIYHSVANNGLTVISRNPEDKPKLPSLPKMAWNYAKAIAKHVATGAELAGEEEIQARLDVCALCDQRAANRCAVCGCFLDEGPDGREGKALWKESVCPLGKW